MLIYTPWSHQNVSKFEIQLLVAVYEEGGSLVCREVLNLQDGEGRASEVVGQVAASVGSHVEMGSD